MIPVGLGVAVGVVAALGAAPAATTAAGTCQLGPVVVQIGSRPIHRAGSAVVFGGPLAIDADGAPRAYHPTSRLGLDHLANAGGPGKWWGVVTDTGEPDGTPVVQGQRDPAPGFYVSATSLVDSRFARTDPRRYVDATRIPYVVVPRSRALRDAGVRPGDFAAALHVSSGRWSPAIVADIGPRAHLGEGSIALAERLGLPANPRRGGAGRGVVYLVFPRSGNRRARPLGTIKTEAGRLLRRWGGTGRLRACGQLGD